MRCGSIIEISADENGVKRQCAIASRCGGGGVYVRIRQVRQDCYLELAEVAELYAEMRKMLPTERKEKTDV